MTNSISRIQEVSTIDKLVPTSLPYLTRQLLLCLRRSSLLCLSVATIAIAFGVLSANGFAQTATLQGSVTDETAAVIPSATVIITNTQMGTSTSTTTNGAGLYVAPFVQPGLYSITVTKPGFQKTVRPGLQILANQVLKVDLVLKLGSVEQTVLVQAGTPLLETQTASLGQQIDTKAIITLPLNGRDYTQLVTLGAGANPNSYSRATNGFSLNGGSTLQTTMQLDGTDNSNYQIGLDSGNVNALSPSIDAIREFKVQTGNYSAQFGRSASGVVSVVLKSGTNRLHGSIFEFLRNDALDANDFFANLYGLPRPPLHRNQFGGVLGGPIWRNRSFFFVSYQGTRLESPSSGTVTVPTPAMVGGNFGQTAIYNPSNVINGARQEFPGNVIPTAMIDPVGQKLASLYPTPNLPGSFNNYAYTQSSVNNADEFDSRFDEQMGEHDSLNFDFSYGHANNSLGGIFPSPNNAGPGPFYTFRHTQPIRSHLVSVHETHIFTPQLVNEFNLGYTHLYSNTLDPGTTPLFNEFGFKGIPPIPGLNGLPYVGVSGFAMIGDGEWSPNIKLTQETQFSDNVSWVHGKHTVTFGAQWIDTHNYANSQSVTRGSFNFSGQFTSQIPGKGRGSAIADLLLGLTSNAGLATPQIARLRNHYSGVYFNDAWQVTHRLNLNVGLRYDLQTPWWDRDNRMSNFDLTPGSVNYGKLVPAVSGGYLARTFSRLDTNNLAPRVGVAYTINPKTVIRSGFGIFYGSWGYVGNGTTGSSNPPWDIFVNVPSSTDANTSSLALVDGFPAGLLDPANLQHPFIYSQAANYPMSSVDQWNLTVQRQLSEHDSLTVAYVGSATSHIGALNNVNSPPPGPGPINPRRPFPEYGNITRQYPYAHATYHALQITYERRLSNGLQILSDYTWGHSLSNVLNGEDGVGGTVPQDPHNIAAEKANTGSDLPNRFVASVIYQVPLGQPGGMLAGNRLQRQIFGRWELGGIYTAQSGYPLTPGVSPNPSNTATPARPDRVCDGNLPRGKRGYTHWYNPACFVPAQPFTYGNSTRSVIRAPGLHNLDFMVDKTFQLTDTIPLEFRAEAFNLANTAHFDAPDMTITDQQAGQITDDISPNREIQFGLRLRF